MAGGRGGGRLCLLVMIKRLFSRSPKPRLRVLMVCTGNICRSPTAEGVLRSQLDKAGLAELVEVGSAGTQAFHRGMPADPRAVAHAARRGYVLDRIRSRPVVDADFERHDLLLAMDRDHLEWLQERCPAALRDRLGLLLTHAPRLGADEVPDPYYGGPPSFDHALDLIEAGCAGLLPLLQDRLARAD